MGVAVGSHNWHRRVPFILAASAWLGTGITWYLALTVVPRVSFGNDKSGLGQVLCDDGRYQAWFDEALASLHGNDGKVKREVHVVDLATGDECGHLKSEEIRFVNVEHPIFSWREHPISSWRARRAVAGIGTLSADGTWFLGWTTSSKPGKECGLWNTKTGQLYDRLDAEFGQARFIADGKQLLALGSYGRIATYDIPTKRQKKGGVTGIYGASHCVVNSDGKLVAFVDDAQVVKLFDLEKEQEPARFVPPPPPAKLIVPPERLAMSPDGSSIYVFLWDDTLWRWELATDRRQQILSDCFPKIWISQNGRWLTVLHRSRTKWAEKLQCYVNWKWVHDIVQQDEEIVLLDLRAGKIAARLPGNGLNDMAFWADGSTLTITTWKEQRGLQLWDLPPRPYLHPAWAWSMSCIAVLTSWVWWREAKKARGFVAAPAADGSNRL